MAYARRRTTSRRRTSTRRAAPARSYRSRAVRPRRSSGRRVSGGARTIRIEVVNATPGAVSRPEIGMKQGSAPRKAAF